MLPDLSSLRRGTHGGSGRLQYEDRHRLIVRADASSTPFARKIAAARHFGLLGPRRAELTELAQEYLRPTEEGAARKALRSAIYSVAEYVKLIEQYENKRINQEMLKNWIGKRLFFQY